MNYLKLKGLAQAQFMLGTMLIQVLMPKSKLNGVDYVKENIFGIPCHHQLSGNEINKICNVIEKFEPYSC